MPTVARRDPEKPLVGLEDWEHWQYQHPTSGLWTSVPIHPAVAAAIREPLESRLEALEEALRMAYQALGANEEWQDEPRRQIAAILGLATPHEGQ